MIIQVKVSPNSKRVEVTKIDENNFKVRVDAKAEEGKANRRLIEILSDYFDVAESSVSILKGLKSRNKIVEVRE